MTYNIVSTPENARLIALLYIGYEMSYDELLKELKVGPKELESLLDATKGLWENPKPKTYRLTEKGKVAYGIITTRNIEIKRNRRKKEGNEETKSKVLDSIKEKISRRFLKL